MAVLSLVVPDDLAARLQTGALRRGETFEEFAIEALESSPLLSPDVTPEAHDALDAFLGCGSSTSRTDTSIDDLRNELSAVQLADRQ